MRRWGWALAAAVVVLSDALVLAGVFRNRTGEPEAALELTEREMWLQRGAEENTGISLWLDVENPRRHRLSYEPEVWGPVLLDRAKLEEIGFRFAVPFDDPRAEMHYEKQLPRETFGIVEFAGRSWEDWIAAEAGRLDEMRKGIPAGKVREEEWKEEVREFEAARVTRSRLFLVDVGNDPEALRQKHPERSRFLILPVVVRLEVDYEWDPEAKRSKFVGVFGSVSDILVDEINVPLEFRAPLDALDDDVRRGVSGYHPGFMEEDAEEVIPTPRYAVDFLVGQRYEPWIAGIRPLPPAGEDPEAPAGRGAEGSPGRE